MTTESDDLARRITALELRMREVEARVYAYDRQLHRRSRAKRQPPEEATETGDPMAGLRPVTMADLIAGIPTEADLAAMVWTGPKDPA